MEEVIRLFYPKHADRILAGLRGRRDPYLSGKGKLTALASTLDGLREKLPLAFTGGLTAKIGPLLQDTDPLFPAGISTSRPSFLFGPQGRETGQWPDAGIKRFGPYKYMQNERNEPVVAVICEKEHRGRVELFAEALRSGFD